MPYRKMNRRLFILGMVVAILGAFTVAQSLYYRAQDAERARTETALVERNSIIIRCIEESFTELAGVLDIRGEATASESALTSRIWDTYVEAAGYLKDDPTMELPPKQQRRLQRDLVAALLDYRAGIDKIVDDRRDNPVPQYPTGKCEEASK